ncbi:MAG: hypothetical protein ACI4UV_14630, partial [Victivallales bacterium]
CYLSAWKPAPDRHIFVIKYHGAGALHLPRSSRVGWSCATRNLLPERSNPLSGENLIHQVQDLRRVSWLCHITMLIDQLST